MDLTTALSLLGMGGLVTWFVRRQLTHILSVVERVPEKEWFERIEEKVNDLPTNKRFEDHFEAVHKHTSILMAHGMKLDKLERSSEDHEVRIRIVERRP